MEEPRHPSAKLLGLPRATRDEIWELRFPVDEEQTALTYADLLVHIKSVYGVSSSMGALHYFFTEEKQKREFEAAQDFSKNAELEMLKDPNVSPEAAAMFAQYCFTAKVAKTGDLKGFVALEQLRVAQQTLELKGRQVEQEDRRIKLLEKKAAQLDEAEAALRAIRGNTALSEDEQRKAVLEKMDEFFGLKKKH